MLNQRKPLLILTAGALLAVLSACSDDKGEAASSTGSSTLQPTQIVGLTEDLRLTQFAPGSANATSSPVQITGTVTSSTSTTVTLVGIDYRAANSALYLLLQSRPNAGGNPTFYLYTVNTQTGAATQVGTLNLGNVTLRALAFNPATDRLRLIGEATGTDTRVNYSVNPADMSVTQDSNLAYVAGDANVGKVPGAAGLAYTNVGSGTTTAYVTDTTQAVLARLGSSGGTPDAPGTGKLTTIGAFNQTIGGSGYHAFDIENGTNPFGYVIDVPDSSATTTNLYRVNLATGALTLLGPIGNSSVRYTGISVVPGTGSNGNTSTGGGGSGNGPITLGNGGIVAGDNLCSAVIGGVGVPEPTVTANEECVSGIPGLNQGLNAITGCTVNSLNNLIDSDFTNYAVVDYPLSLLFGEIAVTVKAPSGVAPFAAGTIAGAKLQIPAQLLSASLLSELTIETYLDDTLQESLATASQPLINGLSLLNLDLKPSGEPFFIGAKTTKPYNAIRIGFDTGLATVNLGNLLLGEDPIRLYGTCVVAPNANDALPDGLLPLPL